MKRILFLYIIGHIFALQLWGKSMLHPNDSVSGTKLIDNFTHAVADGIDGMKRKIRELDTYDTQYIEPNQFNYSAMLQNTNYWQHYTLRAQNEQGLEQTINISPRPSIKVGPYFGWRWLFLGYTFDVDNMGRSTGNTEFTLSLYSAKVGGDIMYIRNKENFKIGAISGFPGIPNKAYSGTDFDGMKSYSTMANVYYVFNHRRFSYPAAYAQSTIQRISAGSFILGLRYDHHTIDFDHKRLPTELQVNNEGKPLLFNTMKLEKVHYYNAGISLGYAYNWVMARNLLFNISIMPSLGYKKTKGEPWDKDVLLNDVKTLNIDFTSRAALVWNNSRWYAGTSFINYVYGYNRAYFNFKNSVSYLNFYVGVNFKRKK